MDAEQVLDDFGDIQGWNDESKLALCLEYIENQKSNGAFSDFLAGKVAEESTDA